ncbi:iron complex transport system substrate-binding protein [Haloactinopolyspora alba]|uniref:Iron complex transport system substrate-binding protein n=1 Tax=Haloactinopolyspora alba TaxID=648780 RepID=A0A2P8E6R9_9ACTN|nr:ABC transporter substrate-binding protein [Haloactinopolyspora alba]PSL05149.1 iron complex transport system substrate-binding protein [Haloactinopolyspora alba]
MKLASRIAALAVLPLLMAACGDDTGEAGTDGATAGGPSSTAAASFPVTVGSGENTVEITERPDAIVSLSPSVTEMLFAIGAGDQVVAVDEYSNYPEEAPTTELSGFEPNAEAIIGYDPDLVVASSDPGQLTDSLDAVGVPTMVHPSAKSLEDTYSQIEQLGVATGHVDEATDLVEQMRSDIDEIVSGIPDDAEPITYFHELDPNLYTVTSDTFVGELYSMAGMESIADEAPEAAGGYPQLSPEFVVSSDPDVIFFADGADAGVTADAIAGRPGWDQLSAVQNGHVVQVNKDIASRWGPRVVDYLRTLADVRAELTQAS